ncbi:hypothetical protein CYLTODRAFT_163765 [Cylindrobasidium torrendii FP15055 ss-10]|uniref:Uncharacterized protein n=1 Tax=Cylindrobasidium torrendii FP15055 ss-10 TaxID=1314674 RepID=A0A0D7AY53_9AGAR|nr:hypothetical protein CYLTODRAFT_163765 [Cylindrobasidium torrendii FP15055 ss-10]
MWHMPQRQADNEVLRWSGGSALWQMRSTARRRCCFRTATRFSHPRQPVAASAVRQRFVDGTVARVYFSAYFITFRLPSFFLTILYYDTTLYCYALAEILLFETTTYLRKFE